MDNSNTKTNDNTFVAPTGGVDVNNMTDEQIAEALNNMTYDQLIDAYVDGLISELGMDSLDDDLKAEAKRDLVTDLDSKLNIALVDALTDEQAEELDKKIDAGTNTPEAVMEYIKNCGVDINEVVGKTLEAFHKEHTGEELNPTEE